MSFRFRFVISWEGTFWHSAFSRSRLRTKNHSGVRPFGDGNFGAKVIVIWKANLYSTHFKIQTLIHKETFVSTLETMQSNTHVELN